MIIKHPIFILTVFFISQIFSQDNPEAVVSLHRISLNDVNVSVKRPKVSSRNILHKLIEREQTGKSTHLFDPLYLKACELRTRLNDDPQVIIDKFPQEYFPKENASK